jgi:hypothetical protein
VGATVDGPRLVSQLTLGSPSGHHSVENFPTSLAGARIPYRVAFVVTEHDGVAALYELAREDYV